MPTHRHRRVVRAASATTLTCALALTPLITVTSAQAAIVDEPIRHAAADAPFTLTPLGSYETGVFDESAAEIVHAHGNRLFVVNAQAGAVDVLDYSDPAAIAALFTIESEGTANSVAIRSDGLGVIAFEAPVKTTPGHLLFFDTNADDAASAVLGTVTVGALPDMVTISDDGAYAVVANEGEPAEDFSTDPEGSVGIVALPDEVSAPTQDDVRTADFHAFEAGGTKTLPADVRVFGPQPHGDDLPVSRNLEPEYIALDGGTAYAALQEANAVAVIDLASASVTDIWALGFKDHSAAGNGLDPSDRDGGIDIRTVEDLKGVYMPDGITSYSAGDRTYLVTANEGDAREWGDYVEASRVKNLAEDGYGPVCENLADLTGDADLGRLNVTIENGFDTEAGCYDELHAFGARSFSIWTTDGEQVFDSGDTFEQIIAGAAPEFFNSNHSESNLEGRSDDKGPEPESLTIGEVDGQTYAFIGFERVGGVMVFDITDPASVSYVSYINNRDFSVSVEDADDPAGVLAAAGDLGPEGLTFIPASESATGGPLLAVANEVSGTTTLFAIGTDEDEGTTDITVLTVNDFHGRLEADLRGGVAGAAVLAGAVDAFEAENPNTLFVSAGDNIGASTFTSFIDDDTPTIDALVAAGLDVGAVGNHEFDQGFDDLTDRGLPRFGGAQFGLGANVYEKGTKTPALDEYAIQTIDGVRVAFIGTVTQDTAAMVTPTGIADIEFGDQLEAANRVAAELTEADAADVIVLLTHSGTATSSCEAVAGDTSDFGMLVSEASADINAIVSAHTHQTYSCLVEGPTGTERPVIQAQEYGKALGKIDLSVDAESKELLSISSEIVPLVVDGAAAFPADPTVAQIVADAVEVAEVEGSVEVGSVTADILRGGDPAGSDRGVESTLGNTVADVYLWAASNEDYAGTPAQIGIMNPGGLRTDLLYGEDGTLTYRDVANVQPFANTLVTVSLTGAQLKSVLEEQWQPDGSERPKLHLGVSQGFSYEYDPEAARGERITSMTFEGASVAADDRFTIVTNSFLAAGGDNFTTFADGTDRTDTGQVDLAATVAYFAGHSPVSPAEIGRAVVADGAGDGSGDGSGEGAGSDWATVELGSSRVEQGGALDVSVRGLAAGQQIAATLHSDPLVVPGIPAADADGTVSFTVEIPADFDLGVHRLVITSGDLDPIEVPVVVVEPGALALTGSELPWGIALGAATLIVAGGLLLALRRRRVHAAT